MGFDSPPSATMGRTAYRLCLPVSYMLRVATLTDYGMESTMNTNDLSDDYLDLRDLSDLLDDLVERSTDEDNSDPLDEDEQDALRILLDLKTEINDDYGYDSLREAADNTSPTLIAERAFIGYAQEFADDIGAIDANAIWPVCHIDWEAAAADLLQDFTNVKLGNRTYHWRAG